MKIAIQDTYHKQFLKTWYAETARAEKTGYEELHSDLLDKAFGTADFYSRNLERLGHEVQDLIVNCPLLQAAWARENHVGFSRLALGLPSRLLRLPVVGKLVSLLPGFAKIALEQVRAFKPDVLYCQEIRFFPPEVMAEFRPHVKLIVGQIASPLPAEPFVKSYDLILTSFPHFVSRIRSMGVASEYFRIGFDESVLTKLGMVEKDIDVSFVGGISRHHGKAFPMLEYLARNTPIQFFGYGAERLGQDSPIAARHHGEVWGLDMYRALARSHITVNRHINVAENNANNMRLFEATGVGTLLLTDRKDNLGDLFEIGKEVVAYSSAEEAAELIHYYLAHPEEAQAIARAGQARTLREHTYRHRMEELVPVLHRYLQLTK